MALSNSLLQALVEFSNSLTDGSAERSTVLQDVELLQDASVKPVAEFEDTAHSVLRRLYGVKDQFRSQGDVPETGTVKS